MYLKIQPSSHAAVHSRPLCKFISLLFRPNYSRYVSGSPDVFPRCEKVKTRPPTAALCIISPRSGYAPAKLSQLSGDSVHRSRGRSMPDAIFEFGFRPRTRTTYTMCTCASNLELSRNCKTPGDTVASPRSRFDLAREQVILREHA